jgi:hypothetical protein
MVVQFLAIKLDYTLGPFGLINRRIEKLNYLIKLGVPLPVQFGKRSFSIFIRNGNKPHNSKIF